MPIFCQLENIRFTHGQEFCLQIKDLSFVAGGLYALTGPNGSGKSTLLQLLGLLLQPQGGRVFINGKVVEYNPAYLRMVRQQITLVEQNPYLFSGSVYKNLAFGLRLRGFSRVEKQRRIAAGLAQVGLAGFEQCDSRELSCGQLQRVALARALVLKPKMLLLDEPTSNSDQEHQQVFKRLISQLRQQGVTVVISNHDPRQPGCSGAQVLHLVKGQLIETPYLVSDQPHVLVKGRGSRSPELRLEGD